MGKTLKNSSILLFILLIVLIIAVPNTANASAIIDFHDTIDYTYQSLDSLDNVHMISNDNYFYLNPGHARNSTDDNSNGTCTTVAMQLLLGYHNYYSDRRIIPEFSEEGERFLNENYADFSKHPSVYFDKPTGNSLGLYEIGTEDAFFL